MPAQSNQSGSRVPMFQKTAIVRKRGDKYVLLSHKGKVLGAHETEEKAWAQERAIQASKARQKKAETQERTVTLEFVSPDGEVKAAVTAEIADTPERRRLGLSKRAELPDNHGMLFDKAGTYWMRDVNFPLDLVFVDINGTVLQKHAMELDKAGNRLYRPNSSYAAHAVELPFGFTDRHGITPGDVVRAKGD